MDCKAFPLLPPKVVAIARDAYLTPKVPFPDPTNLPLVPAPMYGQDITSSYGRVALHKQSVGNTPEELKPKMRKLLTKFAGGDSAGMAKRLVDAFLSKQAKVRYFDDPALNAAAAKHQNIEYFCNAALSVPSIPRAIWGVVVAGHPRRPPPSEEFIRPSEMQTGTSRSWSRQLILESLLSISAVTNSPRAITTTGSG